MEHYINFPDVAQIKAHFRKNKKWYQGFGFGAVAGITLVIMRGQCASLGVCRAGHSGSTVFARPLFIFSNHNKMVNVVAVIAGEGRGHPGFPVICKETGDVFMTQGGAAAWAEVSPLSMTRHLQGKFPDLDGLHFERLAAIPAVAA